MLAQSEFIFNLEKPTSIPVDLVTPPNHCQQKNIFQVY